MKTELDSLIKGAMLSGNKLELNVFRFIKTAFTKFETAENATELTDEVEQKILNKMVKEREESVRLYTLGNRPELAEQEAAEMEVIKRYLPKEATEEEISLLAVKLISENPGKGMGDYIKGVKAVYPTANGKMVSDVVKAKMTI